MLTFTPKIQISCVTKDKGPLTKIMSFDLETGQAVKDGSECSMQSGEIKQIPISSPDGFAKMLVSRQPNQAIVHGICEHKTARVVTKVKVDQAGKSDLPVIARTKEYISYADGPGVILFDHDKARFGAVGSEAALASYPPAELLKVLTTVHAAIGKAAYVSTPSTSSCIYNKEGVELRGEGSGSHTYLFVTKAKDIPRFLAGLGKRLFLANLGRVELSRSGTMLLRTLVDLSVGSPERLDFVAGAVCRDGLEQRLPPPTVVDGEMLDTESLPDLNADEERRYHEIVAALKERAKPGQAVVIEAYIEREAGKLAFLGEGITYEEARKIIISRQDHILEDGDLLYFAGKPEGLTVAEVLGAGEAWHGKSLADPLEPDYEGGSKTKAKFFWNNGNPVIHSFAHGSVKYRFRRFIKEREEKNATSEAASDDDLNDQDAINAMFDRFVFLSSENKIIDIVGHDIKDSMMIERAFIIAESGKFYRYFDEEGDLKVIPLAKHWIMSDQKKIASGLKYKPGAERVFVNGDGRTYYNVFRFPFEDVPNLDTAEKEGRLKPWALIMDQVFHKHRGYIEDWFAYTLQEPQKRAGIMPICISKVGLGKSLVMAIMCRVIGNHNFTNGKILDVTGLGKSGTQWGDWIHDKKISCIEEISPEGDNSISYQVVDALKDIITNETLPLNLKGGKNGTFSIYSNIIGFSNHANCVKIPLGDRRLFVVDSTGQQKLTTEQYADLWEWIGDERNIIAVYQYLRDREISDEFAPGQAKMTKAKQALQLDSRSTMQTAFDLVIEHYPCDLLTNGELMLAVAEAMQRVEGGDLEKFSATQWNADKQYQAIMKTCTTLVAEGKRIRAQRLGGERLEGSRIRAIRNGQKWSSASIIDIKEAMRVEIPWKWLADEDEYVPF